MLALPQQFESMFALRILVGDDFFCSFVSCLLDYVFMFRELTRSLVSELLQFDRYRFHVTSSLTVVKHEIQIFQHLFKAASGTK